MPASMQAAMTMEISGDGVECASMANTRSLRASPRYDDDVASSGNERCRSCPRRCGKALPMSRAQMTEPCCPATRSVAGSHDGRKGHRPPNAPTTTIISRGYVSGKEAPVSHRAGTHGDEHGWKCIQDIVEFTAELEDKLDKVEEGEMDWKTSARDFYPPFCNRRLKLAEQQIEKVEVKDWSAMCARQVRRDDGLQNGAVRQVPGLPELPAECRSGKPIVTYIRAAPQVRCVPDGKDEPQ